MRMMEYDWADYDELEPDYEAELEGGFTPINVFGEEDDEDDTWEEESEEIEGMLYEELFEF